jgi:hypothetical protein
MWINIYTPIRNTFWKVACTWRVIFKWDNSQSIVKFMIYSWEIDQKGDGHSQRAWEILSPFCICMLCPLNTYRNKVHHTPPLCIPIPHLLNCQLSRIMEGTKWDRAGIQWHTYGWCDGWCSCAFQNPREAYRRCAPCRAHAVAIVDLQHHRKLLLSEPYWAGSQQKISLTIPRQA